MNQDQLLSLLRTVLKIAGTLVLAHGSLGINGAMWEQISGVIIMLAPVAWDMFIHTDAGKLAAVSAMPDVKNIVVKTTATDGVAAAAADPAQPKVISAVLEKITPIAAIFILGLLLVPTLGHAQTRALTGNIVNDIRNVKSGGNAPIALGLGDGDLMTKLAKPFQDLATFLADDAAGAITLSTQIPALQDGHGQQCWIAMSTAGDVFKAHPVPLTLKVMTDVEALRLLAMTANNLCSNVHCTQVFADLTTMAQAASPVPLAIPGLHDLCSKIPQIALAPPVTPPVTPAATTGPVVPPPVAPANP